MQAIGIGLGSVIYDFLMNASLFSLDFKRAVFISGFSWLILWLFSKRTHGT